MKFEVTSDCKPIQNILELSQIHVTHINVTCDVTKYLQYLQQFLLIYSLVTTYTGKICSVLSKGLTEKL